VQQAERNKAVVRAFVEAVNGQDWDRLDDLVAAEFVRHSHAAGPPPIHSRQELKAFLRAEFEAFPDWQENLEDLLAEGGKVAARHRCRGTQRGPLGPYPPSGKILNADYLAIYRIEGGRIVEAWAAWDNLSGLTQLGHHRPSA
jgi:steroid delta-isomerase-like uncharacterized protein